MHYIKGGLAAILAVCNVLILAIPFFSAVLLKITIPGSEAKSIFTTLVTNIARQYNRHNALIFLLMGRIKWNICGLESLSKTGSYLVISNHQSWADIPVLQQSLEPHIPLLKFFLKKELLWVPVLGAAWWALDFPFMKRYSREFLEKHPEKRGEDFAETKRMCDRFKNSPVSVMNFLEGTRYTRDKHQRQSSNYLHLLKPKAGGAALVINSMGDIISTLLDVSIHYEVEGDMTLWKLYSGQVKQINLRIKTYEIPPSYTISSYEDDTAFRTDFKQWIHGIWEDKDAWLNSQINT